MSVSGDGGGLDERILGFRVPDDAEIGIDAPAPGEGYAPKSPELHFVVGGKSDGFTAADLARLRALSARAPSLAVDVLPSAGHWVHVDDPDAGPLQADLESGCEREKAGRVRTMERRRGHDAGDRDHGGTFSFGLWS